MRIFKTYEQFTLKLANRISAVTAQQQFFIGTICLFIVTGVFFSLVINTPTHVRVDPIDGTVSTSGLVSPDEGRHFGNIEYYAKKPILDGPIITNADPNDLWLGEIERFPSYAYYYVMSFPARILYSLGFQDQAVLIAVRLLTVLIGAVCLWIFRKLLSEMTTHRAAINLSVFLLSITGAFVWMSASASYDIPALTLFLLTILMSVRAVKYKSAPTLLLAYISFLLVSITKYTYLPFGLLVVAVATYFLLRKVPLQGLKRGLLTSFKLRRIFSTFIIMGLLFSVVAFTERIIVNTVTYHSVDPSCNRLHSVSQCMKFAIFKRNGERRIEYNNQLVSGEESPYKFHFFLDTGSWLHKYYQSTFTYRGAIPAQPMSYFLIISSTFLILMLGTVTVLNRTRLLVTGYQKSLFALAGIYAVGIYLINLKTRFTYGIEFAHQGRYLLFSLAIFYVIYTLLFINYKNSLSAKKQAYFLLATIPIILTFMIFHSSLVSFVLHVTGPEWFNKPALEVLPNFIIQGL